MGINNCFNAEWPFLNIRDNKLENRCLIFIINTINVGNELQKKLKLVLQI